MKKILVALDGSPRAQTVLGSAVDFAQKTNAKLILLRAFGLPEGIPVAAFLVQGEALAGILERDMKRSLDTLAQKIPQELIERIQVKLGVPWQVICETAEQENVDLIVIGAHGYGRIDRLLGTTAARVVNHANRSVLVVRAREGREERGD